jgi:hypothetical protein
MTVNYESSPSVPRPPPRPEFNPSVSKQSPLPEKPCDIAVWAMTRDARYVLAVEALSTKIVKVHEDYGDYHREMANVRVVSSLKEPASWLPSAIVKYRPPFLGKRCFAVQRRRPPGSPKTIHRVCHRK